MRESEAIALNLAATDRRFRMLYRDDPEGVLKMVDFACSLGVMKQRQVKLYHGSNVQVVRDYQGQMKTIVGKMFGRRGPKEIRTKSIISSILLSVVIKLVVNRIVQWVEERYFSS